MKRAKVADTTGKITVHKTTKGVDLEWYQKDVRWDAPIRCGLAVTFTNEKAGHEGGAYFRTYAGLASDQWTIIRERDVFFGRRRAGSGRRNWASFMKVVKDIQEGRVTTGSEFWFAMHDRGVDYWTVN